MGAIYGPPGALMDGQHNKTRIDAKSGREAGRGERVWRVGSEWNAYYRLCLNRLTNCSRQAGSYEHSCFVVLCVKTR